MQLERVQVRSLLPRYFNYRLHVSATYPTIKVFKYEMGAKPIAECSARAAGQQEADVCGFANFSL